MKRRSFLAITGLAGAAVSLSACSGNTANGGSQEEISKDTTAELTFFYWDKVQTPTVEANIAAFNRSTPTSRSPPRSPRTRTTGPSCAPRRRATSCPTCSG